VQRYRQILSVWDKAGEAVLRAYAIEHPDLTKTKLWCIRQDDDVFVVRALTQEEAVKLVPRGDAVTWSIQEINGNTFQPIKNTLEPIQTWTA
jgi:hypothetical protein